MAGVRSDADRRRDRHASGSSAAMPNTPALIGQGIAGLYRARRRDRRGPGRRVERLLAPTGELRLGRSRGGAARRRHGALGLGPGLRLPPRSRRCSKPAAQMGLTDGRGAAARLADASPARRRWPRRRPIRRRRCAGTSPRRAARRTRRWRDSKPRGVKDAFVAAILAARDRARELGDEFGARLMPEASLQRTAR